jgi:hypothetical protein
MQEARGYAEALVSTGGPLDGAAIDAYLRAAKAEVQERLGLPETWSLIEKLAAVLGQTPNLMGDEIQQFFEAEGYQMPAALPAA